MPPCDSLVFFFVEDVHDADFEAVSAFHAGSFGAKFDRSFVRFELVEVRAVHRVRQTTTLAGFENHPVAVHAATA